MVTLAQGILYLVHINMSVSLDADRGSRSVKWLARIDAIADPSEAPVQKKEVRCGTHTYLFRSAIDTASSTSITALK